MRKLCYLLLLSVFYLPAYACDDTSALYAAESAKLLELAPTFQHAWEDKTVQLNFSEPKKTQDGCVATMQLTLPQQDLDEVNADLNENPAKRILLGAQGYTIPEQATSRVEYFYQVQDGKAVPSSNNQALNNLHNSLEYMYQNLAQQRIALKKGVKNTIAWDESLKQSEHAVCKQKFSVFVGNLDFACTCRVDNLSRIMSPRQMALVHYIESQPYSAATGALNAYNHTSKEINEDCNDLTKK
jgi:hypothetical protein